jgi:hypothetical protein
MLYHLSGKMFLEKHASNSFFSSSSSSLLNTDYVKNHFVSILIVLLTRLLI